MNNCSFFLWQTIGFLFILHHNDTLKVFSSTKIPEHANDKVHANCGFEFQLCQKASKWSYKSSSDVFFLNFNFGRKTTNVILRNM